MKPVRYILLAAFVFVFLRPSVALAQDDDDNTSTGGDCQQIDDKEAQKNFDKSKDHKKYSWDERKAFLQKALELEPDWADANMAMAKMIMNKAKADGNSDRYPAAEPYLKKVCDVCPKYGAQPFYLLGTQYYLDENYPDAIIYLQKFIDYDADDPKKLGDDYDFYQGQAKEMLRWSKFFVDVKKNPHPFNPHPVNYICTSMDEYLAIISPDNTMAMYIRRVPVSQMDRVWGTSSTDEVFTQSFRQPDGTFDKGTRMDDPFNQNPNEGGPTLTIDNKHLFYTITKDGKDGPNTDIYTTDFIDGSWTPVRSLGDKVNDPVYWDSQPSVSADGNTLYFASNRPGGQGGIDIWVTHKGFDGEWGVPENLGPTINTSGDEKSPFIHTDSQTLYFSSTGFPGLGGYDIYYSRANEKGVWQTPVNMGIPINTEGDDIGLFV
ncbi:MAG TPA: hypothetical protein VFU15_15895, partial [Bacteroidia bacterium]|nr:hypothetical protein [Bacteroidia bacterium]